MSLELCTFDVDKRRMRMRMRMQIPSGLDSISSQAFCSCLEQQTLQTHQPIWTETKWCCRRLACSNRRKVHICCNFLMRTSLRRQNLFRTIRIKILDVRFPGLYPCTPKDLKSQFPECALNPSILPCESRGACTQCHRILHRFALCIYPYSASYYFELLLFLWTRVKPIVSCVEDVEGRRKGSNI